MKLIIFILIVLIGLNNVYGSRVQLQQSERDAMTSLFNKYRNTVTRTKPAPTGTINPIVWNAALEQVALYYTSNCSSIPPPNVAPGSVPYNITLFIQLSVYPNITALIDLLYSQGINKYDYYARDCTDYTQSNYGRGTCTYLQYIMNNATTQFACLYSQDDCSASHPEWKGYDVHMMQCFFYPGETANLLDYPYNTPKLVKPTFNATEINALVNDHNRVRSIVKPVASPSLSPITWNQTLADQAAKQLLYCDLSYSKEAAYGLVSENTLLYGVNQYLYFDKDVLGPINNTEYQGKFYNYWNRTCTDGYNCDHYLMMISNITQSFGCARRTCLYPGGNVELLFYVCQYYPASFKVNSPYTTNETRPGPPPIPEPSSSIDWRKYGKVSPVKNQGGCGSCWAFSAVATVESALLMKSNVSSDFYDLSEQEFVDCITSGSYGCNGGSSFSALLRGNITTEANYPYRAVNQQCLATPQQQPVYYWSSSQSVGASKEAFVQTLQQSGPFSVYLYVGSPFYSYSSGIFKYDQKSPGINHAVTLVGYDLAGDYWIIKNSWSTNWGENGYIRIKVDPGNWGGILSYGLKVTI